MKGERDEAGEGTVPMAVLASLRETRTCVDEVRTNLLQILSMAEPEVLDEMPPLHRAQIFLVLAKAATELLSVRLRCSGIRPDDHAIKTEHERLSLYKDKLERFSDWSKAPLRPSTKINYQAATRFIEHSLPDLTPEQRQNMRKISRGERFGVRFSENEARKKGRFQSVEKQSVRAAAQEFLEKASRELLGSKDGGVKGPYPLRAESSDEADESSDEADEPTS